MLPMPIFLIDNGHGKDTPGKRSPDGRFREYNFNREVAAMLVDALKALGIQVKDGKNGAEWTIE